MKIIKKIFVGLAALIVLLLIAALFVKKDYAVERQIVINKPRQEVFDYIRMVKNQRYYSVWVQRDPTMKKSYKGTDGTVGFTSFWQSDNKQVGTGSQEITKIVDGKRMDTKLRFKVPFEAEDDCYMIAESVSPAQTKVRWGFTGAFPYPMNLMQLMMNMDKEVGSDFEKGLSNLKQLLENN